MRIFAFSLLIWGFTFPAYAISFEEARHLLSRTGFGIAMPTDIDALMGLEYEAAVDKILDGVIDRPLTPIPDFQTSPKQRKLVKKMNADERRAFRKLRRQDSKALKHWWIREMLATPSPLTERMVLFWSNHFVSELRKVNYSQPMYAQQAVFRENALGDFATLLKETSTGPAMLVYLDGNKNVKGKPNENFAREVLELFTLGEGQGYTETDIREAARAFTGWRVNFSRGGFLLNKKLHDDGRKTFLGDEGFFDGMDILDRVLKHPRVAEFITEKLWREFVSEQRDDTEIKRLAKLFRDNDLHVKPLLKAIFLSDAFRAPANVGSLIKSPVDLVIGTARLLKASNLPAKNVFGVLNNLGQNLFDPPDVKGWRGGNAWISATTTMQRSGFVSGTRRFMKIGKPKPANMMKPIDHVTTDIADIMARANSDRTYLQRLVLALPPVLPGSPENKKMNAKNKSKRQLLNLMLDPVYQLK
jgi:uncharacterized protein (DUF1800 family)